MVIFQVFFFIVSLFSCVNLITITIHSNKLAPISYKLAKKTYYTISDLQNFSEEDYVFIGYSLNNKDFLLEEEQFNLDDGQIIYAHFGIKKDFFEIKSIGKVSISTDSEIDSKEEYQNARIEISKDDYYLNRNVNIRLRGNSTLWVPKKSYKLKFSTKENVMGMGSDKEWALLANYFDPTYLRNYYAYKLAIAMGLEYSIDIEFVEVFLNNKYQGLYLLTEAVKTSKERVDIEGDELSFLLELDDKLIYDNPNYLETIDDEMFILDNSLYNKFYAFGCKYPKSFKDISEMDYEYIKEYMSLVFESVRDNSFYNYIDVDSFIDYYLIQELFMNADVDYSSVFMYKKANSKLAFGPIWDFDLSSGNVGHVDNYSPYEFMKNINGGSYLFETALKRNQFRLLVKERLAEINNTILPWMISSIEKNKSLLSGYAKLDNDIWHVLSDNNWVRPEHLVNITYAEQVEYFKSFITKHNDFLCLNY